MGPSFSRLMNQSFFIPKPTLTDDNLPDQTGRVFVVTGGYAGCGLELTKMLYRHNGTVYVAGRSRNKGDVSITAVKAAYPNSKGRLEFLQLDLADLSTIKQSANDFLSRESRLDVLTNNAGVMDPPAGSVSAQNFELQMATNCLGHFLFTKLLLPILSRTAELPDSPTGSVRVTWGSSSAGDLGSPKNGVTLDKEGSYVPDPKGRQFTNYGASKAGDFLLAAEFAHRYPLKGNKGVISNSWNPGNLKTELQRNSNLAFHIAVGWMLYPARFGGYTELFAGWSEEAGRPDKHGSYIIPWGRFGVQRDDVMAGVGKQGGTAEKFWDWCEKETRQYG